MKATGHESASGTRSIELGEILPARMLNEFVYCPRLFYYEHVEGVFLHNADTLEGKAQHKRVDNGKGALPKTGRKTKATENSGDDAGATEPEPEIIHSRSVSLYSEKLGVSAKLDLVEGDGENNGSRLHVTPVEYKKGAPREGDDGIEIWDADRMQLGLQVLLLRENGFACDRGMLFYRETRQRVPLVMDGETELWIHTQISNARACTRGPIPPPLDHSPKCPRCSLAPICLPDETRMLQAFSKSTDEEPTTQLSFELIENNGSETADTENRIFSGPFSEIPEIRLPALKAGEDVRRLIAPDRDAKALYVNTPGQYVSKKGEQLIVKEEKKVVAEFRLLDINHLALFGPVQLSTAAVQTLCERDIPITYFSMGGWFYGMTRGHGLKNVFTRIEQFARAGNPDSALDFARLFVHGKIRNQRTFLMRNHLEPPANALYNLKHLASQALNAPSIGYLLGLEGAAANIYFKSFGGMLKTRTGEPDEHQDQQTFPFFFESRNRRPPKDPVNALLSLAYSLLAKDCTLAAYAVGFDPYVGFYHQPRFGRPALALDLMEEFRPILADSAVLRALNTGQIREGDFIHAGNSVSLHTTARKRFFHAYERRLSEGVTHPVFGYRVSYRRALELQARLLAKVLTGEIEHYVPFVNR